MSADASATPVVSVVVPIYNEQDGLEELHQRLETSLAKIAGEHEVVYVDDGSSDGSAATIARWARAEPRTVLVQLSRNFGMEVAMAAGLDHAAGSWVVLMHADLQDPPELIPEMLATAQEGADVVYARRIGRDEGVVKRVLATAFYAMMQRLARVPYQGQAGDFRLMSRRVVDTVRRMPERRRFVRGMVAWVGFEQVPIEYRRAGRQAGRGASYPQLVRLAVEALTSFSDVPLSLATILGGLTAMLSALAAAVILVLTAVGDLAASIEVWTLVVLLFLGGVQLISVGIVGRYLARVHEQGLQRPLYVVDRVVTRAADAAAEPLVPVEPKR